MCEDEVEGWAYGTTLWYTVVDCDVTGCGTLDKCLHYSILIQIQQFITQTVVPHCQTPSLRLGRFCLHVEFGVWQIVVQQPV